MQKRIVIKLGTSVLTSGTQKLDRAHLVDLVRQCSELHSQGHDVILCSSGAIAAGRERLGYPDLSESLVNKQMLAAVGQNLLMLTWDRLFDLYNIHVGQILLTRADMEDRARFLNARDTLTALLAHRIVPIINENDAVATAEIKVGDNDNLSAYAVVLAEAHFLILLTDQPGLFTADPRMDPDAALITEVSAIDDSLRDVAGASTTGLGIGGMTTKLQAADAARRAGAEVIIASGHTPNVIQRIVSGDSLGTRFPALETPLEYRKRWIFAGPPPSGRLVIDEGAARALTDRGSSLLPAGILKVIGAFERGDTVLVLGPNKESLGRGITRYSSNEVVQIMGRHSKKIEELIGYAYGPVVVHRNDMILV